MLAMHRAAFPKSYRLTSNEQFRRVIQNHLCEADSELTVYACPNGMDVSRLGVSVGKGSGPAVIRNRLKRLIREAFRCNKGAVPDGVDLVVMPSRDLAAELKNASGPHTALASISQNRINSSFLTLIGRLREKTTEQ
jgi:ribonuclease P protein component